MNDKTNVGQPKSLNTPLTAVEKETIDNTIIQPESSVDATDKTNSKKVEPVEHERDLILTHKDAQAASPDDIAACGEEDIGAGLEFLVTRNDHAK